MRNPTATVLGFAYESPVVEFPVRSGPGTTYDLMPFKAKKGLDKLEVLDVQPDSQNTQSPFGRVYQWFQLLFPDGQTGWMRGHVVGIYGDFSAYGYGVINTPTHAYTLIRDMSVTPPALRGEPAAPEKAAPQKEAAPEKELNPLAAAARAQQVEGEKTPAQGQPAGSPDAAGEVSPARATKEVQLARPSGPPVAIIATQGAANTRQGPSTVGFERVFTIPRGERVPILEVRHENRARRYRWFRVNYQGRQAWLREDLCYYDGDTEEIGLPWDLYPAPMGDKRWWVRGYNMPPNFDDTTWEHNGWDLGAPTGEPIRCGPFGGRVVLSFQCRKCLADRPNTPAHGLGLGNKAVFSDEGWGWGYGHFVIVRYTHDQLPPSTQRALAERGYPGGSLFVNYAHLERRMVEAGQELEGGTPVGTCGNTGNSEATHLHLEVRAGHNENFPGWAALRNGLVEPEVLFKR
jgi:hypothetical protein